MDDLARKALAVNQAFHALGNERFEADGATFIRNLATPDIWDANHVTDVTAGPSDEIERLLQRAEREYAECGHRRFDLDFTTPPQFEARLTLDGYQRSDDLVMLLAGELVGTPKPHDIRPITDDTSWDSYAALQYMNWRAYVERTMKPYKERVAKAKVRSMRAKAPPMRYWLAYVEGEPRAYAASWQGIDGVGQVEDLFTHPDFRHRGLTTALIHHGVADCRAQGAGPVIIVADPMDTPKQLYAAMGFRPVAVKREYRKDVEPK